MILTRVFITYAFRGYLKTFHYKTYLSDVKTINLSLLATMLPTMLIDKLFTMLENVCYYFTFVLLDNYKRIMFSITFVHKIYVKNNLSCFNKIIYILIYNYIIRR